MLPNFKFEDLLYQLGCNRVKIYYFSFVHLTINDHPPVTCPTAYALQNYIHVKQTFLKRFSGNLGSSIVCKLKEFYLWDML